MGLARLSVRRTRSFVADDIAGVRGLPVTAPARLFCDLAGVTGKEVLRAMLIDARQRRLVAIEQVAVRAARLRSLKGLRILREVVWELDGQRCDSILEWRLRMRLRDAGFQPAPAPVPVATGGRVLHVDIGWPERRVGIEVDGFGSHSDRGSLEVDILRHNALELAGWRVLRAGWTEAGTDFPRLAEQLTALLPTGVKAPARM